MTVTITGPVEDVTGIADNASWQFASVLRFTEDGTLVTAKPKTVYPVAGILTVKLKPGPTIVTYGKQAWNVTVPDTDGTLKELIEEGIAFPPQTAQEALDAAVAQYVETNRNQFKTRAVPITSGPDAGKAQWVDANDDPVGDPVTWDQVIGEAVAEAAATAAATTVTPGIVTADIEARGESVIPGDTPGTVRKTWGDAVSGEFPAVLGLWSGVAGKPTVATFADLLSDPEVDTLAVGERVQVRDGATYEVQSSGTAAASVASYVVTPWNTFPRPQQTGYHVITNGGTKLRSVSSWSCPTHFGAVGDGSTVDTAAVQMATLYAADCGTFQPRAGIYVVDAEIVYFGRVKHFGSKLVKFFAADDADIDAVFVPHTWGATDQTDMVSKQFEKFRPEFYGIEIDCNGENNGAHYGIILTSTEARVCDNWIIDAVDYGILLTPYAKNGTALPDGYNLLQNWVCGNRIWGSGKGGILCLDTSLSQCTDGWMEGNSITNGTEWGIYIEGAQGWKVRGNQVAAVRSAIGLLKPNNTIVSDSVIYGFGDVPTVQPVGERHGIFLGGLTVSHAKAAVANNTIHAWGDATPLADGSTAYYGITFAGGAGGASKDAHIGITGNVITFNGFSGTTNKVQAIRQQSNSNNNITGIIAANSVISDETATGAASKFVELHTSCRVRIGVNNNGGQRVEGRYRQGASASTPTINTDECDRFHLYAMTSNVSSMSTNWSGTPADGQRMQVWFTGTASRTITWGAKFTGKLLAATVGTNTHVQELVYKESLGLWVGVNADPPTGSAALDFGSIAAQSFADLTIPVTGAAVGDPVALGIPSEAVTGGVAYTARVSAANTVSVRAHNYTAGALDPASGTFKATIVR